MARRSSRLVRGQAAGAAVAVLALAAFLAFLVGLAGCGGAADRPGGGPGEATLWVTRDRGAEVLLETTVPAGQTLLRALRSRAEVETSYGGRFVRAIEGLEGDGGGGRDWFWFVNGLAGDTSAAEYRLRAGDVAWWDYRAWASDPELAVVVGAFPEPFLHGFAGRTRPAAVRYAPALAQDAERVADAIGAADVAASGVPVGDDANVLELVTGAPAFNAALRSPGAGPHAAVRFTYAGDVEALLSGAFTRRFAAP